MALFLSLFIFLATFSSSSASEIPEVISGVDVVTGQRLEWETQRLQKGLVVVFVSVKCPCSKSHQESLEDLFASYASKGFDFVGVNSNRDEGPDLVRKHFSGSETKLPFPVIRDDKATLANAFGALATPHAFIVSPQREVLFQGGIANSRRAKSSTEFYLERAIKSVYQGKKPDPQKTRVLGCFIKRS